MYESSVDHLYRASGCKPCLVKAISWRACCAVDCAVPRSANSSGQGGGFRCLSKRSRGACVSHGASGVSSRGAGRGVARRRSDGGGPQAAALGSGPQAAALGSGP